MDYDGQRLLDVINDPNALESFLGSVAGGGGDANAGDSFGTAAVLQSGEPCSFSPAVIPPSPAASSPGLGQANVPASPQQQQQQQQQQRRDSLSSTPVASPINYPPGPGPGSVQLPAGTITIPALATAVGQVQQLVSGGQVLQIVSSPAGPNAAVRHPVANVRVKQPQLRPKPANTASPGPVQSPVMSPRTSSPVIVHPPQPQQQQLQQQPPTQQQQQQHQHHHHHHQQQQQQQQQQLQQQATQMAPGGAQVVQLGAGGPTGTLVFSSGAPNNPMFPALAPTGGQFFLQQQSNGSFQLVVRPQAPPPPTQMIASSPPRQPAVVQPVVQQIARPPAAAAVQQMAPMVRLVTLPGLGTVQLQQIQTPNGPAFLAVQQPQAIAAQPISQPLTQTVTQSSLATSTAFVRAPFVQQTMQQPQIQQQQLQQQQQLHQQQQQQLHHQQQQQQLHHQQQQQVASPNEVNENGGGQTFATPPAKKPPAKKKSASKAKKKPEVTEEKKPAVNLEELLKQTGIVGDDDFSMFMDDPEPAADPVPASSAPLTPAVAPVQLQPDPPALETKENNVIGGAMISEANILQTLQQHGLALASDDLLTLRNFIKPSETVAVSADGDNGNIKPKPTVSLTLSNGQVIQLTEPQQPAQSLSVDPAATATTLATPVAQNTVNHGFQNEFLEDLARSQIVPEAKKAKKQTSTPANNNNGAKKKAPAAKKKPAEVASGTAATTTTAAAATTATSGGTRVQTIKLSPQNQQNLRNIQAQIQYLNSKKDPTPQETSLLQKLIEHHQNILATGKPVPTIPGQHAQGISAEGNVESPAAATTVAPSSGRSQNKVVPANIQQNTHLANLLRQPVADKSPRVTATQQPAQRPTQPVQRVPTPSSSGSMTVTQVASPRFVVPTPTPNGTPSSIQTPVGTLLLTVVDAPSAITITTAASDGASTPGSSSATMVPSAETPAAPSAAASSSTATRGVKRPAPAPKPSISKNTLFEHQLKTDQNGALSPDCKTPFTSKTNACKRLIRYHVFHELDPSPAELEKEEDELEERADQLLSKFHSMVDKYHHLLLVESTKDAPASEYVMVERMFVSEEKQSLERLKEEARVAKELNLTPVWPVKTEPVASAGDTVNGRRDSPCDDIKPTPKMGLLKFTRKDGEGYRSEIQEYKEIKSEDVMRNGLANHCAGQDRMAMDPMGCEDGEAKPYDEWAAIQRELALYPDNRDKEEMDFGSADEALYDDDIKAQMQNAIDDLLKLNGCDEIPAPGAGPAAFSALTNGDQYGGGGGGDGHVDMALNEAVNSIL